MNHRSWAGTEGTPLSAGSVATARWKKMTYDLLMGIIVLFLGVSYIVFRIADITTSSCAELNISEKGAYKLSGPKNTKEDLVAQCSVCGRAEASFEFPGTTEKFCWGYSADFATIVVLTTEIDSATLAGVSSDDLRSERCDISRRVLDRSQSVELG
jgi:hypothetical protein